MILILLVFFIILNIYSALYRSNGGAREHGAWGMRHGVEVIFTFYYRQIRIVVGGERGSDWGSFWLAFLQRSMNECTKQGSRCTA
jgi:hypothetical protein